jgi:hypothetical protein
LRIIFKALLVNQVSKRYTMRTLAATLKRCDGVHTPSRSVRNHREKIHPARQIYASISRHNNIRRACRAPYLADLVYLVWVTMVKVSDLCSFQAI